MLRLCTVILILFAATAQAENIIVPPATVLATAKKLAYKDFPKVVDIISIIRVESAFKADAINLEESKRQPQRRLPPSRGLMQVQNGSLDPQQNMEQGVALLREYYILLGHNRRAAVKSYNVGIGSFRRGQAKISAEQYWQKFSQRRREYVKFYADKGDRL